MKINTCPVCEDELKGRSDKKFCTLKCKSAFQYQKNRAEEELYFKIDRQLRMNRKLLKKYNQSGLASIRKGKLIGEGFNPKYFTHYWKNAKGDVYLFCYEYGFLPLNKNGKEKYVLIKWQDYME